MLKNRSNLGRGTRNASNQLYFRANLIPEQHEERNETDRNRFSIGTLGERESRQSDVPLNTHRAAFHYSSTIDYNADHSVAIGSIYKDAMCDDILHQMRIRTSNPNFQLTEEIYNEVLILIGDMCLMMSNRLLS